MPYPKVLSTSLSKKRITNFVSYSNGKIKKVFNGIMNLISVKIPETFLEGLDDLVRLGVYPSRSEAIRVAIRDLLRKELWDSKRRTP